MRISDGRVIWSATDLKKAAECEFAWLRAIDAKLGRTPRVEENVDEMMQRAINLGLTHEHAVLDRYRHDFPGEVIELATVDNSDRAALEAALHATEQALASDARVLYQGAFEHDDFIGFADFMVRTDDGWLVQDTKLARSARVTALMQLAAYVDQLHRLGVKTAPTVELLLGNGETSCHRVSDLMPVFELRRARIRALIADRDVAGDTAAIAWGDERGDLGVLACGRCETCEQEVVAHRDLLLVAGMRPVHRRLLRDVGVTTIDALATASAAPENMNPDVFQSLRLQAQLQLQSPAGVPEPDQDPHAVPAYEVVMAPALSAMPRPSAGDMFFDFEGDPLYTEGDGSQWGLDYLFGWVDTSETFSSLWAHTFAEEKAALVTFLETVAAIRRAHPGMHIYHYAPYEPTHLTQMAARHGVGESAVAALLSEGVFVDLYPIVKRAVRVGSRSYSIKKLEPLYMGDQVRTEDVQNGGDSIGRYVEARALAADGHRVESDAILADLAAYNRYDCVSTRRLRDWLIERAVEAGRPPAPQDTLEERPYEQSSTAVALLGIAASPTLAPEHQKALRLAAAAIDYYPREAKAFWGEHYSRLSEVLATWEHQKDVLAVNTSTSTVIEDWHSPERGTGMRRILHVRGVLSPGSSLKPGAEAFAVYERPAPFRPSRMSQRWLNVTSTVVITEVTEHGVIVTERSNGDDTWDAMPIALTPGPPPHAGAQQGAINQWADQLLTHAAQAKDFENPAWDLLMRRAPRTISAFTGGPLPEDDKTDRIVRAISTLERSYLAVQGPPGTGKTYVAARVIARLVKEHGYRIGVVAQSHDVVEHVLKEVIEGAGLSKNLVGKAPRDPKATEAPFTIVQRRKLAEFARDRQSGFVMGGTAWDFAHDDRVPRGSLDLLVVDEAGQFSLASTIACSVAARKLLLLGDPQQLPQVSQGTHPEPVDTSALGWLMADADVLQPEFGYFLERSWRMHPEVASAVSELSYDSVLTAHPSAAHRRIDGIPAGVHVVPVAHRTNTSHSPEEAAEVVRIVADAIGKTWHPGDDEEPRELTQADIIVVTPYNAQQQTVADALAAAGFPEVRVGTVDKFQGQEAAISILSLAASTARDAPRGLEFLLLKNRINVAVSRAQVASYVIYSPWLLDDLPRTPAGVAQLSAFARLIQR